jgi:hypothetical protein
LLAFADSIEIGPLAETDFFEVERVVEGHRDLPFMIDG